MEQTQTCKLDTDKNDLPNNQISVGEDSCNDEGCRSSIDYDKTL